MRNHPSTYEGFMPNEQHLCENGLDDEAIVSIMERMSITRREATLRYEMWENSL